MTLNKGHTLLANLQKLPISPAESTVQGSNCCLIQQKSLIITTPVALILQDGVEVQTS